MQRLIIPQAAAIRKHVKPPCDLPALLHQCKNCNDRANGAQTGQCEPGIGIVLSADKFRWGRWRRGPPRPKREPEFADEHSEHAKHEHDPGDDSQASHDSNGSRDMTPITTYYVAPYRTPGSDPEDLRPAAASPAGRTRRPGTHPAPSAVVAAASFASTATTRQAAGPSHQPRTRPGA